MNHFKSLIFLAFLLISQTLFAQSSTPVGTWITIDDKSNKPRAIMVIWESYGKLYGKVQKTFLNPGDTGYCKRCPGAFRDKRIQGLTIMWEVKQKSSDTWAGGEILDPESGHIYKVTLKLSPNGKSLDVRGYIGVSLFGRTQVWHRK